MQIKDIHYGYITWKTRWAIWEIIQSWSQEC